MAKLRSMKISRRTVDAIAVERETVSRDSELRGSGFGVRFYASGRKVCIVQTRARGDAGCGRDEADALQVLGDIRMEIDVIRR